MKKVGVFLVGLLLVVSVGSAYAALVDETPDETEWTTVKGVDWLDLATTKGVMQTNLSTWLDSGWSYASKNQYDELVSTLFGVSTDDMFYDHVNDEDRTDFFDLFGITASEGGLNGSYGWIVDATLYLGGLNHIVVCVMNSCNSDNTLYTNNDMVQYSGYWDGMEGSGTFLVRTSVAPVPEPATMLLFGLGLLGLAGVNRRKQ